jgi:hypothetical protein
MSILSDAIPELDRKGMREFGLTTGVIVAGLFGLFFPWILDRSIPSWPWIVCGVLIFLALVAPTSLRPIYRGWMRFGLVMARVTTPLILGLAFFLVITPTAAVWRLLGTDPMARGFDAHAESYRVRSAKSTAKTMEKPY